MALEKTACILFDYGVQVLVGARDGIERVDCRRTATMRD
jgi:hypothetical protein